jgi:hypothetical protein
MMSVEAEDIKAAYLLPHPANGHGIVNYTYITFIIIIISHALPWFRNKICLVHVTVGCRCTITTRAHAIYIYIEHIVTAAPEPAPIPVHVASISSLSTSSTGAVASKPKLPQPISINVKPLKYRYISQYLLDINMLPSPLISIIMNYLPPSILQPLIDHPNYQSLMVYQFYVFACENVLTLDAYHIQ